MKKTTYLMIIFYIIFSILFPATNISYAYAKEDSLKFKGFYINMPLEEAINIVKANYKYSKLEVVKINGLCGISIDPYSIFNMAIFKYNAKNEVKYISLDKKIVNELFNVNDLSNKEFIKMFIKAYSLPKSSKFDDFYEYISSKNHRLSIMDKDILLEEIPGNSERKFD